MSRPESVSSRIASLGSKIAICRISSRFFSPPEKPTLRARLSISSLTFSVLALARTSFSTPMASRSASPRLRRWAFSARLEEGHGGDAGDLDRILHRQEDALGGAFFRRHRRQVFAIIEEWSRR